MLRCIWKTCQKKIKLGLPLHVASSGLAGLKRQTLWLAPGLDMQDCRTGRFKRRTVCLSAQVQLRAFPASEKATMLHTLEERDLGTSMCIVVPRVALLGRCFVVFHASQLAHVNHVIGVQSSKGRGIATVREIDCCSFHQPFLLTISKPVSIFSILYF